MNQQLLILKGMLASLPPEDQAECQALVRQIHDLVKSSPKFGLISIAIVSCELEEQN